MFLLPLSFKQTFFGLLALSATLSFMPQASAAKDDHVAAQGLIKPKGDLIHLAAPTGQAGQAIVQSLEVKLGDAVKKGQVIATLSNRAVAEAELTVAQQNAASTAAAVAIIEARLKALDSEIAAAQSEADAIKAQLTGVDAAVKQAQAGVDQAQKARREALEKLDAGMSKITGTRAAYQNTLDELDPPRRETEEIKFQQKLLDEEYREVSASRQATVARLDAEVAAAEAAVAAAQSKTDAINAQAKSAEAGIATIEANKAVIEAELKQAQAATEAANAAVAQAKAYLALTQVKSPIDGTVLRIGARPGEAVGPAGVVALADMRELHVEAEIYIDDARKVKAGQSVMVRSDAYEGELPGTVVEVGQLVNPQGVFNSDPLAFSDKRVVLARIKLEPISGWAPPVNTQVIARIAVKGAGE